MSTECYPIATLPHVTKLYRDYLAMGDSAGDAAVRGWYGAEPLGKAWMRPVASSAHASALADVLERQSKEFGAGPVALENIAKIRAGARAVVTGQQVGLLGGPLYVLLKAATAIARAKQATAARVMTVSLMAFMSAVMPWRGRPWTVTPDEQRSTRQPMSARMSTNATSPCRLFSGMSRTVTRPPGVAAAAKK